MLGIGFLEIVVIALVCFIAVGPKQLPMIMRKIAGFYRQFVALRDEFKFQIMSADNEPIIHEEQPVVGAKPKIEPEIVVIPEQGHG